MTTAIPVTQAVRTLRAAKVAFIPHIYRYEERGGTRVSARELGVDEHRVIKTIVLETDAGAPLIALMHGDREVSTRSLARLLGVKTVQPCTPAVGERVTGYQFGGTSPLGTRKQLSVYAHESIRELPSIYINGGKRGFLVEIAPAALESVLAVTWVDCAA